MGTAGCGNSKALEEELTTLQADYESLQADYAALEEEKKGLEDQVADLEGQVRKLKDENGELKNGAASRLVAVKNSYEAGEWQKVVDLAADLHKNYNGTKEDQEAQKMAEEAGARLKEEEDARAAREAQGYETGITYDQLARTPDDYEGEKVKFRGEVVQVIEGDDSVQIRLAVNGDYDRILLGEYEKDIVSSRVLEDDTITIYGTSVGTISYESTMGGQITIPGVYIEKIDQ